MKQINLKKLNRGSSMEQEHKCNIIKMPNTAYKPYMSTRDMELLLGGIVSLMRKYAHAHQIEDFISSLREILKEEEDRPSNTVLDVIE